DGEFDERIVGNGVLSSHFVISGIIMMGITMRRPELIRVAPAPSAAALGRRPENQRTCGLYSPVSPDA
ncbi:hypothetical protein ACPXCX_50730, partial [Streptomyces sp. DT225]